MGFVSCDCKGCGRPLISDRKINKINEWMQNVTIIEPETNYIYSGIYDGFGNVFGSYWGLEDLSSDYRDDLSEEEIKDLDRRIETNKISILGGDLRIAYECWHTACHEAAGQPFEFTGVTRKSPCKGYFYDDPQHDVEAPTNEEELEKSRLLNKMYETVNFF